MKKVRSYNLTLEVATPEMVKLGSLMQAMDLGISGIYEPVTLSFKTTTKWNKSNVLRFIKEFEKHGWIVATEFQLQENIS